ncbi:hypothetical protein BSKO_03013 [Bryopsis sp. KO-2023]|nr:hypothetical protein BSKO_03013 [Bryopsis sp. KO-2023]
MVSRPDVDSLTGDSEELESISDFESGGEEASEPELVENSAYPQPEPVENSAYQQPDPTFEEEAPSSLDDHEDDREGDGNLSDGISNVPFEVLEKLRSTGEKSVKVRKKAHKVKRANKNRPLEMSSKRPISRFRNVLEGTGKKKMGKDPRFQSLAGNYDVSRFRQQYSFLYDEHLPDEEEQIKKKLKKSKNEETKQGLRDELRKVRGMIREEEIRRKKESLSRELKAGEMEAVKGGKRPFYLKKGEKKKRELVEKFKELQESGNLDKYMAKMRKKKASKDHRLIPSKRRGG